MNYIRPMGGNIASFDDENKLKATMEKIKGERNNMERIRKRKIMRNLFQIISCTVLFAHASQAREKRFWWVKNKPYQYHSKGCGHCRKWGYRFSGCRNL